MTLNEQPPEDYQSGDSQQIEETNEQKKERLLLLIKQIEKFETEQQLQILSDFLCLVLDDLGS